MTPRRQAASATAARLLGALEILVGRQAASFGGARWAEALAAERRAAPLIAHLARLGPQTIAAVRPRLGALLARRGEFRVKIAERRARLEGDRRRLEEARGRLQQVARYARTAPRKETSRLNLAG